MGIKNLSPFENMADKHGCVPIHFEAVLGDPSSLKLTRLLCHVIKLFLRQAEQNLIRLLLEQADLDQHC